MPQELSSFNTPPLCWEFARNVQCDYDPEKAIIHLVDQLRSEKLKVNSEKSLCLARKILKVEYLDTEDFDGKLEPLGDGFDAGFQMFISRRLPSTRQTFTLMHELMHTFFYEYLPTKKFENHFTDEGEERLCNFGAAHLLMPAKDLRKQLKGKPICLETAEALCSRYSVSLQALVVRLRHLKLWNVQLSTWVQLSNGKIVIEGSVGKLGTGWSWMEGPEIEDAFKRHLSKSGYTYLTRLTPEGDREVQPIRYDLIRVGRFMHVLSGPKVTGSTRGRVSLFRSGCRG